MANIKETLISTMQNGRETLLDIAVSRKNGRDIVIERGKVEACIAKLHREKLNLEVSKITERTKNSKTFRLFSTDGYLPPFIAGQYINITVEIEGVRTTRPYSISSAPFERAYYEITVARQEKGFVADYFLDKVKVGDKFEANGPAGSFYFNPVFHYQRSVFLAGGSGITPFVAMAREVLDKGIDREIYLIYGSRNAESAIFAKELEELSKMHSNFHFSLVLSDEGAKGGSHTGFIDAKLIKSIIGETKNTTFYLCGPTIMTDFCDKALHELAVRPRDIRREMFGSSPDVTKEVGYPDGLSGTETFTITVAGKKIPALSKESVLQALERSGVRVNVCCRSGECSLCRVKMVSGKVFMPRGALLRFSDEKFGYIHSCKAYPISDIEIML